MICIWQSDRGAPFVWRSACHLCYHESSWYAAADSQHWRVQTETKTSEVTTVAFSYWKVSLTGSVI
jgi:hypothetical protein